MPLLYCLLSGILQLNKLKENVILNLPLSDTILIEMLAFVELPLASAIYILPH